MLFNSIEYLLFLPLVLIIYWNLRNHLKSQNLLILLASYFFYGLWDYRFLSLIVISSATDFLVGKYLYEEYNCFRKKVLLGISLFVNLGLLVTFKYYNFFLDSLIDLFTTIGFNLNFETLNIILPVGISFYTFQTLSYTIDIYRGKLNPSKSILNFFTYVAFFPQLVAGPIERASNLLPQINKKRVFSYQQSIDGLRQILWGLFKKVVIADNCAVFANHIFENYESHNSIILIIGVILFAFQIYGDFSGYSDIAIGTAKLLGIKLIQNFSTPYFSRDIAEFWRRWHISLSTWFRDYLYIPLGGSRVTQHIQLRNIFIIFLVSGFWHGANWTFIFWGLLHAIFYIPQFYKATNRKYLGIVAENKLLPTFYDMINIINTFILTSIAWIFFRSPSISDALMYIQNIFTSFNLSLNDSLDLINSSFNIGTAINNLILVSIFIIFMIITEWINRGQEHGLKIVPKNNLLRYALYLLLSLLILEYFYGDNPFIYFQF